MTDFYAARLAEFKSNKRSWDIHELFPKLAPFNAIEEQFDQFEEEYCEPLREIAEEFGFRTEEHTGSYRGLRRIDKVSLLEA